MNNVRASQLMPLRKKFHDQILIKIIKNKVAQRAFEKISNVIGIQNLSNQLEGQCALMFTNINPFKLNLLFDQNKVFLPAKGGDVASSEIIIPAGNTGIPPGPVLSEFKEANVQTKIDQGSITVTKDTVVVKRGQIISQKLASLLTKLNIKPIEAGIAVNYAISEGLQFQESDLKLDLNEYIKNLQLSFKSALNLAIESAYVTNDTLIPMLSLAYQKSINLASESGYVTKDTAEIVIKKAETKAFSLMQIVKSKGYNIK
jgi:large subunit ribosomal protein L10